MGQHEEHGKEDENKQLLIQTKNRKAKNCIQGILVGITSSCSPIAKKNWKIAKTQLHALHKYPRASYQEKLHL